MSFTYAVSIYTKLTMDLPTEWVTAFSALRDAAEPGDVCFPDFFEDTMGEGMGKEVAGLIRYPRFETKPTYDFGRCLDHLKGGVEHYSYHLTFWNLILDDIFYHFGYAFLMFLAKHSEGNRFAGTIYEITSPPMPELVYFLEGELEIVKLGEGTVDLEKLREVGSF